MADTSGHRQTAETWLAEADAAPFVLLTPERRAVLEDYLRLTDLGVCESEFNGPLPHERQLSCINWRPVEPRP